MLALFQQRFPSTGLTGLSDGVDLSGFQAASIWGQLDWVKWSCAKVTEGTGFTERLAVDHSAAALNRGIPWGLYHFARFADVNLEAQRYLAGLEMVHSAVGATPHFHMLDLEASVGGDVTVWAERWCQLVEAARPAPVVVYTGPSWANSHLTQRGVGLERRPLWVAHYAPAGTVAPWVPALWADWAIWQWTSTPAGLGNLDVNVARPSFLASLGAPIEGDDVTRDDLLQVLGGGFNVDIYQEPSGVWRGYGAGQTPPAGSQLARQQVPVAVAWLAEAATLVRSLDARVSMLEQTVQTIHGAAPGTSAMQIVDELVRRLTN